MCDVNALWENLGFEKLDSRDWKFVSIFYKSTLSSKLL